MSKILNAILVLCVCGGFMQGKEGPLSSASSTPRTLTVSEQRLVNSDNAFGFKLFKEVVREEKDRNIFISPLSVAMALGMAYNGASGNTQEAMRKTLELSELAVEEVNKSYEGLLEWLTQLDPEVQLHIANSIWYRQELSFEEEFIDLNKIYFKAKVKGLDFNDPDTQRIINGWVNENTKGKIKKIVDVIDPLAVMFLIDAIYFKGIWTRQFDKPQTRDDWFELPDGSKKLCKMMVQRGSFQYFEHPDFQAIDLPYGKGDFSMSIFLPHPDKDLDSLIAEFNRDNWTQWIDSFSKQAGVLDLPKFSLEYGLSLNEALKSLDMTVAFDPDRANFAKMYQGPEALFINKVKHKTFVEVDEEGTEAAAVTSVEMRLTSVAPSFSMRVDRPFVFVIREKQSGAILFIGKIVQPIWE